MRVLFFVFSALALLAQTAGTGAITGTVTDATHAVIPNVTVTAISRDTGQARTVTTGADGSYKFALLPPGDYKVTFTATGFKAEEVPTVTVAVTETPVLNRILQVGAQTDQVTIE